MAEPTYAEQRLKAAQLLIGQKHAGNATDPVALASAGGRPAFTRAMNDFQKAYNADPANKDNPLQDPRDMSKLVGALETTAARKSQAPSQAPSQAQVRAVDNAVQAPNIDPDIQKAQAYMRALGITEVEVDGQKQEVKVDGLNSPATSAALAKYRADNGFDNNDNFATVLDHMQGRIKQNPPGVQQFMSETMADGQQAGGFNVMAMQMILNLLAPLIQSLSGGKIDLAALKVDGINGPRTTNAYNGYNVTMNDKVFAPAAAATPPQAGADPDPLGTFIEQKTRESDARLAAAPQPSAPAEIRVRPGESTAGIAAAPGVIPTVIVGDSAPVVPGSRPALPVDGGQTAGGGSYARSSRAYAGDTGRYQQTPPGYGEMRQQYYAASGAEVRDRMLQQRAELRETGYAPRDVKAIVRDARVQELEGSGMGRRAALSQANMETRMVDNIERGYGRADRAYGRVLQAEDRDITRITKDFGRAASIYTDRNPRNDHKATGMIVGAGIEGVLRGGIPGLEPGGARGGYGVGRTPGIVAEGGAYSGREYGGREYGRMVRQEDRDITRISKDFSRATSIYMDGNARNDHKATGIIVGAGIESVLRGGIPGLGVGGARGGFGMGGGGNPINALISAIGGGRTETYAAPPLQRGAYSGYDRSNSREWGGNQIRPEFDGARSYGNTNDPRMALAAVREQQIMAADQPQQTAQERMAEQQRMREMYSPG